ncbi:MAG: hypothetical protein ACK55I_12940, partial [bacterium]
HQQLGDAERDLTLAGDDDVHGGSGLLAEDDVFDADRAARVVRAVGARAGDDAQPRRAHGLDRGGEGVHQAVPDEAVSDVDGHPPAAGQRVGLGLHPGEGVCTPVPEGGGPPGGPEGAAAAHFGGIGGGARRDAE